MSLNFCDLLVIGSDLSGLIAATLLAKRGLSVVVIDDESQLDDQPNCITSLNSHLLKTLFSKLSITDSHLQIIHKNKVAYQVVFPKNRLDIFSPAEDYLKEIEREFPECMGWYEKFLNRIDFTHRQELSSLMELLPLHNQKEKRRFAQQQQNAFEALQESLGSPPPSILPFLRAQIMFHTNGALLPATHLQWYTLLLSDVNETYSIRGGMKALKKLFFERIEYYGGTIYQDPLTDYEILAEKKTIRGIQLARLGFPTHCRLFFSNINLQQLETRLPQTLMGRLFNKSLLATPILGHQYSLQFLLPYKYIPTPMQDNVLIIKDPQRELVGANYLQINMTTPPKIMAKEGEILVTASYYLKSYKKGIQAEDYENIHREIEDVLYTVMPFAKDHVQSLPTTSAHHVPWYAPSLDTPTLSSPFSNHLVLGPDMLSWLGTEGKVLAAQKAVEIIWKQESKRNKL
jgi:hypothetical protein